MLGGVGEEGEHVVEDASVHDAVEVNDADVAGEELEDGRHIRLGRRPGVFRAASGKRVVGMWHRFVHGRVVIVQC